MHQVRTCIFIKCTSTYMYDIIFKKNIKNNKPIYTLIVSSTVLLLKKDFSFYNNS